MIELVFVPREFVGKAWRDGASRVAEACAFSCGEITGDQLKSALLRGERTLVDMRCDGANVGWGVVREDVLPNCRALMVTDMATTGEHVHGCFEKLKEIATARGYDKLRCAADEVRERFYRKECGLKRAYAILEVDL
jgi:hypothetical protein